MAVLEEVASVAVDELLEDQDAHLERGEADLAGVLACQRDDLDQPLNQTDIVMFFILKKVPYNSSIGLVVVIFFSLII